MQRISSVVVLFAVIPLAASCSAQTPPQPTAPPSSSLEVKIKLELKKRGLSYSVHKERPGEPLRSIDLSPLQSAAQIDEVLALLESCDIVDMRFDLRGNDDHLRHLKGWKNLKFLRFFNNPDVTGTGFVHLTNLSNLQELHVQSTPVTGDALRHLPKGLRTLGLRNTQVGDAGLIHLQDLTQLKSLNLSRTKVGGDGLVHLKGLTQLESLTIDDAPVTDRGLESLASLENLRMLSVSPTDRSSITDAGLARLGGLAKLRQFSLRGEFSGEGFRQWSGIRELEGLNLFGAGISDAGIENIALFEQLKHLALGGRTIRGHGFDKLHHLRKLESLSLESVNLSEGGWQSIARLPSLVHLSFRFAPIDGRGLALLASSETLRTLRVVDTDLSKNALSELAKAKSITSLEFERTLFSDAGLEQLSLMQQLSFLSVLGDDVSREAMERFQKALPKCRTLSKLGERIPEKSH